MVKSRTYEAMCGESVKRLNARSSGEPPLNMVWLVTDIERNKMRWDDAAKLWAVSERDLSDCLSPIGSKWARMTSTSSWGMRVMAAVWNVF